MARRTLVFLFAMVAGTAYAESTSASSSANATSVVNIILPSFDSQAVMGSVMGVDKTATSYYLTCPTDTDASQCGLGTGLEVIEGSAVLELHMTETSVATADISCAITSNTASCTSTIVSLDLTINKTATISSMVTETGSATVTNISSQTMPVTITAGLDLLSSTATAASTAGAPRTMQNAILVAAAAVAGGAMLF